jgi:hypothetical protein
MIDPTTLNGDAGEQLRTLVLALTDKDALRGLVGQHPGLEVMRTFHQEKNGFNDLLHPLIVQGLISAETANRLSKDLHVAFFQHVAKAFNMHAMPIMIESFRANLTAEFPAVLNQVETAVKGLRLHVGADSLESGFDHVVLMKELNNICKGIQIFSSQRDLAVRNLSLLAVRHVGGGDMQNIYGFSESNFSLEAAADTKYLDAGNEIVKRLEATITTMEGTCVVSTCGYVQRTAPKKDLINMKDIRMPAGVKLAPDAKIARELAENFTDYLMQHAGSSDKLAFAFCQRRDDHPCAAEGHACDSIVGPTGGFWFNTNRP